MLSSMKRPINHDIEYTTEQLFQAGTNHFLSLERNGIDGWHYTLLDVAGNAVCGGYVDEFYCTSFDAAMTACKLLNMADLELKELPLTIQDLCEI